MNRKQGTILAFGIVFALGPIAVLKYIFGHHDLESAYTIYFLAYPIYLIGLWLPSSVCFFSCAVSMVYSEFAKEAGLKVGKKMAAIAFLIAVALGQFGLCLYHALMLATRP